MAKNFVPSTTEQTIGTTTKRWRSIYVNKINTNDIFINDVLVTFSSTIPDVAVSSSQYAPVLQNGLLLSFVLEKYAYDKSLLLRIQSHPNNSNTAIVSDYRDIPYSDFTITSTGLTLTNYNLTNMTVPVFGSSHYNAYLSFLYVTPTGLKGNLLPTPATVSSNS